MRLIINLFFITISLLLEFGCDFNKNLRCQNFRKVPYKDSIIDCSTLCCGYKYAGNSLDEINFEIINFTLQDIEVFVNNFKLPEKAFLKRYTEYDLRNLIPLKNYVDTITYYDTYFKTIFTTNSMIRDTLIDNEFYIDTTKENRIKIKFLMNCEEVNLKVKKYSRGIIIIKDTINDKYMVFYRDCGIE